MNKFNEEHNEYMILRCSDDTEVQINFYEDSFGLILQKLNKDDPEVEEEYRSIKELTEYLNIFEFKYPEFFLDWDGVIPSIDEFRKLNQFEEYEPHA